MCSVAMAPAASAGMVVLPYHQIADPSADLSEPLSRAFGPDGLGVLTISGIPNFEAARRRLLPLSTKLACLPPPSLAQLEDPESQYNFGWSCGKEALVNGQPDTFKGSFYANPCRDHPSEHTEALTSAYPEYFRCNLWPHKELPELRPAFLELARDCMYRVGLLLAEHCDKYIAQQCGQAALPPSHTVHDMLCSSRNHTARLLHYFPTSPDSAATMAPEPLPDLCTRLVPTSSADSGGDDQLQLTDQDIFKGGDHYHRQEPMDSKIRQLVMEHTTVEADVQDHEQSWCGWHTDHSALTGLTRAMYTDMATGKEVACRDPHAGLYVRNRAGNVVKVNIPEDHVAFQVGEALQVLSGGLLRATPHYVRAPRGSLMQDVSRNTLALFMQPDVQAPLRVPPGFTNEAAAVGQWQPGQTFGEFARSTFQAYYKPAGTGLLHTLHSEVATHAT